MSRKTKFMLNTFFSLFNQIINIISGFILPRYMLLSFGSSTNGLVSSISQFLAFISFMQMGIGVVIQSSWYKPLSDGDTEQVSKIYVSAEKFFRKIALIFVFYTIGLAIFYPLFADTNESATFIRALIAVMAIQLFAQYFWGITNSLLLQADQKSYVPQILATAVTIINVIISVLLMKAGYNVLIVKTFSTIAMLISPVGLVWYVKRNYQINRKIEYTEEPIKQKWSGFAQHVSAVIVDNTDIMVLTVFSTLNNVSIYYVYYIVVNSIKLLIMSISAGVQSLFGSMLAKGEAKKLNDVFNSFELLFGFLITLFYSMTLCLISPFVRVYTNGIDDVNYYSPLFATLITIAFAMFCYRTIFYTLIKAAGHFKETQTGAIVEVVINLVVSISCVIKYGLVGVAIGTLVAVAYRTLYCVWYLSRNILNRKMSFFFKNMFVNATVFILCYVCTKSIELASVTYISWFILAIKKGIICLTICMLIYFIFYFRQVNGLKNLMLNMRHRQ